MVRRSLSAVLVLLALLAPLLAVGPAAAAPLVLAASGPGRHVLVEDDLVYQTCDEEALVTLTYHPSPVGRTFIDVTGDGCAPTFSLLTACQGVDETGWFHCHRNVSGGRIDATLSPEGTFTFSWDSPDFTERIWANMTRVAPAV